MSLSQIALPDVIILLQDQWKNSKEANAKKANTKNPKEANN